MTAQYNKRQKAKRRKLKIDRKAEKVKEAIAAAAASKGRGGKS